VTGAETRQDRPGAYRGERERENSTMASAATVSKAARIARAANIAARAVHIKIHPTARSLVERREVLRVLEGFGEVEMFRSLRVCFFDPFFAGMCWLACCTLETAKRADKWINSMILRRPSRMLSSPSLRRPRPLWRLSMHHLFDTG